MLNATKLWTGAATAGDALRYGQVPGKGGNGAVLGARTTTVSEAPKSARARRPVVFWNITRRCNLRCVHCYANAMDKDFPGELTTAEGLRLLDDLAAFGVPAVILTGGEPLCRPDIFELAAHAHDLGLRLTLSTNGTLIDFAMAERIHAVGFAYVGISFDGMGEDHDKFRRMPGAFQKSLEAVRYLAAVGQPVGLRLTLTRRNYEALPRMFELIEKEGIRRACFYHLVHVGRGEALRPDTLTHEETRRAVDMILDAAADFQSRQVPCEILTVDCPTDGVYLYTKLRRRDPVRAKAVRAMLEWNGGGTNGSGVGCGCVDWSGNVHPDQFWHHYTLGNVRERPFSEIWQDTSDPLMGGLKNRVPLLKGRCRSCQYLALCGGGFRVRAERAHGNPWMADPACYLTDKEIGLVSNGEVMAETTAGSPPGRTTGGGLG